MWCLLLHTFISFSLDWHWQVHADWFMNADDVCEITRRLSRLERKQSICQTSHPNNMPSSDYAPTGAVRPAASHHRGIRLTVYRYIIAPRQSICSSRCAQDEIKNNTDAPKILTLTFVLSPSFANLHQTKFRGLDSQHKGLHVNI